MGALLIIILIIGLITFLILKQERKKPKANNVIMFVGAPRQGKTLLAVKLALKQTRFNWLRKLFKKQVIYIYSNIWIKSKYFKPLAIEHLELNAKIKENAIVLVDEVGLIYDQFNHKLDTENLKLDLLIRLSGHFINGMFIFTDQSFENTNWIIKRRVATIYELSEATRIPKIGMFHTLREYHINGDRLEEINILRDKNSQEIKKRFFTFYTKKYNTRAYKLLYDTFNDQQINVIYNKYITKWEQVVLKGDIINMLKKGGIYEREINK